jgi:hypothetical protein
MDAAKKLATVITLFEMLKSGRMRLSQDGVDVTECEIEKLKPEIVYLERIIAHPHDWWKRPPYESTGA